MQELFIEKLFIIMINVVFRGSGNDDTSGPKMALEQRNITSLSLTPQVETKF